MAGLFRRRYQVEEVSVASEPVMAVPTTAALVVPMMRHRWSMLR